MKRNPYRKDKTLRRLSDPKNKEKAPIIVGIRAFDNHLLVLGKDMGADDFAAHLSDTREKGGQKVTVEYVGWQNKRAVYRYRRNPSISFLASAAYGKNGYRVKQRLEAFRVDPGSFSEEFKETRKFKEACNG